MRRASIRCDPVIADAIARHETPWVDKRIAQTAKPDARDWVRKPGAMPGDLGAVTRERRGLLALGSRLAARPSLS